MTEGLDVVNDDGGTKRTGHLHDQDLNTFSPLCDNVRVSDTETIKKSYMPMHCIVECKSLCNLANMI